MNFIEIQFSLRGKTLPADHGYALYSALKQSVLQEQIPPEILLCSVPGVPNRQGIIYLNHSSKLRLRCPAEQVQTWYRQLQNQVLDIRGHLIRLIQPQLVMLQPSEVLKSRLVVIKLDSIKHHEVPQYFVESCQKALSKLEIQAQVHIDSNVNGDLARRAIQIKGKSVVGYGVVVEGLSVADSLELQCTGLGGRKHFGCGWFYPAVKEVENAA